MPSSFVLEGGGEREALIYANMGGEGLFCHGAFSYGPTAFLPRN